jgi:adenylate cyclase
LKTLIVLLAGLLLLRVVDPWPVETLRLKYFDALLTISDPVESQNISLYNIDEAALAEGGQWPWPRQQLAELNRSLLDAGAAAVVYSVLFPEEDRFGGDAEFAGSMAQMPTFLSAVATTDTDRQDGWQIGVATLGEVHENAINYSGILPNVQVLQDSAIGTGVVNTAPEVDGLVRRVPMVVRVGESLYPALGLDVLRGLAGDPSYQVRGSESGIEAVRVPNFDTINTDAAGRVWIDWVTSFSSEPLAGTIVFVGVTAAGVSPLVPTPRGLMFPHEIQATLFETLLAGTSPVRPDWALGAEFLGILLLGLSVALVASRLPVLSVPVGVLAIGALTATSSVWGYLRFGVLVDAAFPVISSLIVGSVGVGQRMVSEYRQKLQIKGMFGTYVSPKLVQQLVDDPSLMKLGGDTKILTCLFVDIVGFTPVSERFQRSNDPQGLVNKEIEAEGLPRLGIGIGVNTGTAVIGNTGGHNRFMYSPLGDSVNEASRYESSSRKYEQDVLIGETTAQAVPDMVEYLDSIEVKGKSEKLEVYTLSPDAIAAARLAEYWVSERKS